MKNKKADILIVGSGIAGLSYAEKVARNADRKIIVVSKAHICETNTRYAQGGIAVVTNTLTDSFHQHIADTLESGAGLCDSEVVSMVVKEAPQRIQELVDMGVSFDLDDLGMFALGKEGGHSAHRIVHTKDHTGLEIQNVLIHAINQHPNVEIINSCFAVDLILEDGVCMGASFFDEHEVPFNITANQTVLATGGIGQLYEVTTNPEIATGDGIAMASRAGAVVENMAFIQFHPTAFYEPDANPSFLISEAVRGFGAELKNKEGVAFMYNYDARGSLATRDIVARSIFQELRKSKANCVYLDLRDTDLKSFASKFPTIFEKCRIEGIDLEKDMIPVVPAAHYLSGGIKTDINGLTTIPNLYCLGESACTGMHGANRLASNSLLEALFFADRAAKQVINKGSQKDFNPIVNKKIREDYKTSYCLEKQRIKSMMTQFVGIVRSRKNLEKILTEFENSASKEEMVYNTDQAIIRNMKEVARLIISDSIKRPESIGGLCFECA